MKKITVKKQAALKLRRAFPLIVAEDLKSTPQKDGFIDFVDEKENFLGRGYLSKQNKGAGWLLSQIPEAINQSFYEEKFQEAKRARLSFFQDDLTTAFRIFNGEGDGLGGVTVDYYAEYAVFSWYNPFIYTQSTDIIAAFQSIYPEIKGIYEKIRFEGLSFETRHIGGKIAPEPLAVMENGVTYATYMNEGLMTGIFLDQKEVRGTLASGLVAGKTLLNMFSYTGAFSVAAAMGGAVATTSVDLAKRSLPKTTEQFEVNHLNLAPQKIIVMDVFDYFKYASRKGLSYDMIILDPPSFARNKKKVFSVAKNYGELVKDSIDILTDKGTLIASTNAANLSLAKYQKMVITALQEKNVRYKITDTYQLPADFQVNPNFPEGNYLKVLFIEIEK